MIKKEGLNNESNNPYAMRNITRVGLGFIAGFFVLFGLFTFKTTQLTGIVSSILGVILFFYAYKSR
mgnify:CR=1 FL=1